MMLLYALAATLTLFGALILILWGRQHYLARRHKGERPCGCQSACAEHLYQIAEPASSPDAQTRAGDNRGAATHQPQGGTGRSTGNDRAS